MHGSRQCKLLYRVLSSFIAITFMFTSIIPPNVSYAQLIPNIFSLPAPGTMVTTTPGYIPTMIKAIRIDPANPLHFNFIVDTGESGLVAENVRDEADKLIKYFLASLTVPEEELWVNLSPYEQNRIIPTTFGQTEMGRDLLAQDYMLKQLTASLMYPEKDLGKEFWKRVYDKAEAQFGTRDIPLNTFNKIWIVPNDAVVYEHNDMALVVRSHLKVMLAEDYKSLQASIDREEHGIEQVGMDTAEVTTGITSEVVRQILIPEIEKEVNEGKTFANLRQIYNSMILATWFKQSLRESLLGQVYVDQAKTKGVDVDDPTVKDEIYNQYLKAFQVGVYDYIKEDYDPLTQQIIPRKYFSGGVDAAQLTENTTLWSGRLQTLPRRDQVEVLQATGPASFDSTVLDIGVNLLDLGADSAPSAVLKQAAARTQGDPLAQSDAAVLVRTPDEKDSELHALNLLIKSLEEGRLVTVTKGSIWDTEAKVPPGSKVLVFAEVEDFPAMQSVKDRVFNILVSLNRKFDFRRMYSNHESKGLITFKDPKTFNSVFGLVYYPVSGADQWAQRVARDLLYELYGMRNVINSITFDDNADAAMVYVKAFAELRTLEGDTITVRHQLDKPNYTVFVRKGEELIDVSGKSPNEVVTQWVQEKGATLIKADGFEVDAGMTAQVVNAIVLELSPAVKGRKDAGYPIVPNQSLREAGVRATELSAIIGRIGRVQGKNLIMPYINLDSTFAELYEAANGDKASISEFAESLGLTQADQNYASGLYTKFQAQQAGTSTQAPLVIGQNFKPSALLTADERRNQLGAVEYADEIEGVQANLEAAKQVNLVANPMNGGLGSSVKREDYLRVLLGRDKIGAKGTDLFFDVTLQGFDENGNAIQVQERVSITELKYIEALQTAAQYGSVTVQELVNEDSIGFMEQFLDETVYLFDRIDQRPNASKRTYRQVIEEAANISTSEEMIKQGSLPVIDVATGELTADFTAPGGHGQLGSMVLQEALDFSLTEGRVDIRTVFNGDGVNNSPDPYIIGWMARENIPIVMISTTKTPLDTKGGLIGLETMPDGKVRAQMLELAQVVDGQQGLFRDMGLTEGEAGAQYFNTNVAVLNYSVLQPFLKDLITIIGQEQFNAIVTPDLIANPKEKDGGRQVVQLEGAMGSALLNLNAFVTTTDNKQVQDLMARYGYERLLYVVNADEINRSKFFTPTKFAWDHWLYSESDHFAVNAEQGVLENTRPGHLPGFNLSGEYKDVEFMRKTFGTKSAGDAVSVTELDSLTIEGRVFLKGATLKGNVVIVNNSDTGVNLVGYKSLFNDQDELVLENVRVEFNKLGQISVTPLSDAAMIQGAEVLDDNELNHKLGIGTSGWRDVMDGEKFTLNNVGRIGKAVAAVLDNEVSQGARAPINGEGLRVAVTFGARPMAPEAAQRIAEVLEAYGIEAVIGSDITTTPAAIALTNSDLGNNAFDLVLHFDASHNPLAYNGMKLAQNGVVAPETLTNKIVEQANKEISKESYLRTTEEEKGVPLKFDTVSPIERQYQRYRKTFAGLETKVRNALGNRSLTVDAMHGASAGFLKVLEDMGANVIRKEPMKSAGLTDNYRPEPLKKHVQDTAEFQAFERDAEDGSMYMAIDGDSDRLAVWVKRNGQVEEMLPNDLGILFGDYLITSGRTKVTPGKSKIVKTQPTSFGLFALARKHNLIEVDTPVGSKWFAPHMDDLVIAVEESGHLVIRIGDEIYFDDAVVQAMLLMEIFAQKGENPFTALENAKDQLAGYNRDWRYYRNDIELKGDVTAVKDAIVQSLEGAPLALIEELSNRFNQKPTQVFVTISTGEVKTAQELEANPQWKVKAGDGIHFKFADDSWVQFRLSGTEPIIRLYAEGPTSEVRTQLNDVVGQALLIPDEFYLDAERDQAMVAEGEITSAVVMASGIQREEISFDPSTNQTTRVRKPAFGAQGQDQVSRVDGNQVARFVELARAWDHPVIEINGKAVRGDQAMTADRYVDDETLKQINLALGRVGINTARDTAIPADKIEELQTQLRVQGLGINIDGFTKVGQILSYYERPRSDKAMISVELRLADGRTLNIDFAEGVTVETIDGDQVATKEGNYVRQIALRETGRGATVLKIDGQTATAEDLKSTDAAMNSAELVNNETGVVTNVFYREGLTIVETGDDVVGSNVGNFVSTYVQSMVAQGNTLIKINGIPVEESDADAAMLKPEERNAVQAKLLSIEELEGLQERLISQIARRERLEFSGDLKGTKFRKIEENLVHTREDLKLVEDELLRKMIEAEEQVPQLNEQTLPIWAKYVLAFYSETDSVRFAQLQDTIRGDNGRVLVEEGQEDQDLISSLSAGSAKKLAEYQEWKKTQVRGAVRKLALHTAGVIAPVIKALNDHDVFELFKDGDDYKSVTMQEIVDSVRNNLRYTKRTPNDGYLHVVMRALASEGWITRKGESASRDMTFTLTDKGKIGIKLASRYYSRVADFMPDLLQMRDYLNGASAVSGHELNELAERSEKEWNLPEFVTGSLREQVIHHLDGFLVGPILVAMHENKILDKFNADLQLDLRNLEGSVKSKRHYQAAFRILQSAGFVKLDDNVVTLTPLGLAAFERALSHGVGVSYYPTFNAVEELLFGDPTSIQWRDASGNEIMVNRRLNVLGSGAAHGTYFKQVDIIIRNIVDARIESGKIPQPDQLSADKPYVFYVADTGSGDGAFLEHLHNLITTNSSYAELMRDHPELYKVEVIAIDYNADALDEAEKRLKAAGIPYKAFLGDINRPSGVLEQFQKNEIPKENVVHVRSFLDHNRPYTGVEDEAAARARTARSTGAYTDPTGRAIPNAELEQNLFEHFKRWQELADEIVIIELHTIDEKMAAENLDKTLTVSYDLHHGLSNQLIVEAPVFRAVAKEAGFQMDQREGFYKDYPARPGMTTVTVGSFRKAESKLRPVGSDAAVLAPTQADKIILMNRPEKLNAIRELGEQADEEALKTLFDVYDATWDDDILNRIITSLFQVVDKIGEKRFAEIFLEMVYEAKEENEKAGIGNTPMVRGNMASDVLDMTVLDKLEFLNPTNSFKPRFLIFVKKQMEAKRRQYFLKHGKDEDPVRYMVSASTGNHAIASSWLAEADRFGKESVVFVPAHTTEKVISDLKAAGAKQIRTTKSDGSDINDYREAREEAKKFHLENEEVSIMSHHASPWISAGYSTVMLEIIEQLKEMGLEGKRTVVTSPAGEGGAALYTIVLKALGIRNIDVVAVGTQYYDSFKKSVEAGRPVPATGAGLSGPVAARYGGIGVDEVAPFPVFAGRMALNTGLFKMVIVSNDMADAMTNLAIHDIGLTESATGMAHAALEQTEVIGRPEIAVNLATGGRISPPIIKDLFTPNRKVLFGNIIAASNNPRIQRNARELYNKGNPQVSVDGTLQGDVMQVSANGADKEFSDEELRHFRNFLTQIVSEDFDMRLFRDLFAHRHWLVTLENILYAGAQTVTFPVDSQIQEFNLNLDRRQRQALLKAINDVKSEFEAVDKEIDRVEFNGDAAQVAVLPRINPTQTESWELLRDLSADRSRYDLRQLFAADPNRVDSLTKELAPGFEVDFSKNLIDGETLQRLLGLADETFLRQAIEKMFNGEKINETENRAVLHAALRNIKRDSSGQLVAANGPVYVDGEDVMPEVIAVLNKMEGFTKKVRSGEWKGATDKPIKHVVSIGIGGSDLGPKMASQALTAFTGDSDIQVHYISNIDGTAAAETLKGLDPEETLVIIESKTFTTQETIQNAETVKAWLVKYYADNLAGQVTEEEAIKKHFVAVSTAREKVEAFGIDPENMFPFWDWVGGRYSVWSAIGLPLATYVGFDNFLEMLEGAREADEHFRTKPFAQNIPVLKALLGIWYSNFMGAESMAILPYDEYLGLFPKFAQQFFMESNGKSTDRNGIRITDYQTGQIVWGEAGTDGQHSFYQLIHQGTRLVPADFIAVTRTQNPLPGHHAKLYANAVAQPFALAFGAKLEEVRAELEAKGTFDPEDLDWQAAQQTFDGNKPTTSILVDEMTPRNLGRLIAMYEHQIMAEGAMLNIFSFDQWGVQLGKVVAGNKVLPYLVGSANTGELSGRDAQAIRPAVERFIDGKTDAAQVATDIALLGNMVDRKIAIFSDAFLFGEAVQEDVTDMLREVLTIVSNLWTSQEEFDAMRERSMVQIAGIKTKSGIMAEVVERAQKARMALEQGDKSMALEELAHLTNALIVVRENTEPIGRDAASLADVSALEHLIDRMLPDFAESFLAGLEGPISAEDMLRVVNQSVESNGFSQTELTTAREAVSRNGKFDEFAVKYEGADTQFKDNELIAFSDGIRIRLVRDNSDNRDQNVGEDDNRTRRQLVIAKIYEEAREAKEFLEQGQRDKALNQSANLLDVLDKAKEMAVSVDAAMLDSAIDDFVLAFEVAYPDYEINRDDVTAAMTKTLSNNWWYIQKEIEELGVTSKGGSSLDGIIMSAMQRAKVVEFVRSDIRRQILPAFHRMRNLRDLADGLKYYTVTNDARDAVTPEALLNIMTQILTARSVEFVSNLSEVLPGYSSDTKRIPEERIRQVLETSQFFNKLAFVIETDPASVTRPDEVGGIDLNPAMLNLQIKRDGNGIPLPINQQPLYDMNIEGFLPVIINVTPVANLPLLLGLADDINDSEIGYEYNELQPYEARNRLPHTHDEEYSSVWGKPAREIEQLSYLN